VVATGDARGVASFGPVFAAWVKADPYRTMGIGLLRYGDRSYGKALPHIISRHTHPKAKPEASPPGPPAATGIDYLSLTAAAPHEQIRRDERIGYHALYGAGDDQIPGQLSIDDVVGLDSDSKVSK
jgi:hypothetical protein